MQPPLISRGGCIQGGLMSSEKTKDIPLDWKIELNRNVVELWSSATEIMRILNTMPKNPNNFQTSTDEFVIEIRKPTEKELNAYNEKRLESEEREKLKEHGIDEHPIHGK